MAFDREIAAITTFCEASSASSAERRCVVHTMFNRIKDGRFGKTVAEVCLRRMQFSEWNDDRPDNDNLLRAARALDSDLADCLAAYAEVLSGASDPTNGATHYHDKSIAPPNWAQPPAVQALVTDKFIFYKNVP